MTQTTDFPGRRIPFPHSTSTVVRIDTVRSVIQPNVAHVIVTDSDGIQGLGETFYGASSVEAHIHDVIVPTLAAEKPSANPEEMARVIQGYVGYSGSGAEVRARSAIDIALWDLAAKRIGLPLVELLSPESNRTIDSYNTCSGLNYVNAESRQSSSNWGIGKGVRPDGEYEDLWAFLNEPAGLARELVDRGFKGMKVWPFDLAAENAKGGPGADMAFGLSVLDAIRSEVGSDISLYVELHSLWEPEAAQKLIKALASFDLAWVEDPIRADRFSDLAELRHEASMPLAVGENLGAGNNGYRMMIEQGATDVVIMDLGWCGGITEAQSTIERTRKNGIDIAFHDCTGPVSLAVATHVSLACENASVQEVARAFWHGWYRNMAVGYPDLSRGVVRVSEDAGHGASLSEEFLQSGGTVIRTSVIA